MADTANWHYGNLYADDKYVRIRYDKYIKLIKNSIGKGKKVKLLEIGCYTAELADLLGQDIEYLGLDFDDKALEVAKSRGRKVMKLNFDADNLELKEKFDIIVAAEILEHLLEPQRLMQSLEKLLSEGGIILISLPNENTIYHRIMSLLGLGIDMYPFCLYKHLHFPTIKQDIDFVSKYFKIIRKDYYINPGGKGSRFGKLGIFFRLVPDFIWESLAYLFPGCFARGIIMLCVKH